MENLKNWNIEEETGYKPITTFYMDFSLADKFGINGIVDTFNCAFNEWKNNYKYLTELAMVLNWKIMEHYRTNIEYAKIYEKFFYMVDKYAIENLKGSELEYYYDITD